MDNFGENELTNWPNGLQVVKRAASCGHVTESAHQVGGLPTALPDQQAQHYLGVCSCPLQTMRYRRTRKFLDEPARDNKKPALVDFLAADPAAQIHLAGLVASKGSLSAFSSVAASPLLRQPFRCVLTGAA